MIKIKYKIPNHFPSHSHNRSPVCCDAIATPKNSHTLRSNKGKISRPSSQTTGRKNMVNFCIVPHRASQPSMQSLKNLNNLRRCKNAMKQKKSSLLRFHRNQQSCRGWTRTTVLVLLASAPPGTRSTTELHGIPSFRLLRCHRNYKSLYTSLPPPPREHRRDVCQCHIKKVLLNPYQKRFAPEFRFFKSASSLLAKPA